MKIDRRSMMKATAGGLAVGAATLGVSPAHAKPGGHLHGQHRCIAMFDVVGYGMLEIGLNGTGFASFNNVADYDRFRLADVMRSRTVTMGWEVNRCYAVHPRLGMVSAVAQVPGRSPYGSVNMIMSNPARGRNSGNLFPARMVNMLHFSIEIPDMGLRMFNKDPMVLEGDVRQMTMQDVLADPRYREYPAGFTAGVRAGLPNSFNPVGTHRLVRPVQFFDVDDPNILRATLVSSTIETVPTYGIDVRLTEAVVRGGQVRTTYAIRNATNAPQDVVVYLDDSRDLRIVEGKITKRVTLKPSETITVQGVAQSTNPGKAIGHASCLFCGVAGVGADLRRLVSGFHYSDGADYRVV